ncbi:chlorophyllase [Ranunculus cassubicifolius]
MSSSSARGIFKFGNYTVLVVEVESKTCCPSKSSKISSSSVPPKPLLIATPSENGKFPVLVFLHGFLLFNQFYTQLIRFIASHGFIVVAPQLYKVAGPDTNDEIKATALITDWLSDGLQTLLPSEVQPNLQKLGIAGHSRGGKVAFALALGHTKTSLKYSVLLGIDPVDGMGKGNQTPPPVLTYVPRSFDLDMAVLVIGSGLGEVKKNALFPPCAPKGVNHEDFFNECCSPACYFVVKNYGHMDMLDDDTKGVRGKATTCTCKNGEARGPMRTFVGGIMVAFLKAYLLDDHSGLMAVKDKQEMAPVELQCMEFR